MTVQDRLKDKIADYGLIIKEVHIATDSHYENFVKLMSDINMVKAIKHPKGSRILNPSVGRDEKDGQRYREEAICDEKTISFRRRIGEGSQEVRITPHEYKASLQLLSSIKGNFIIVGLNTGILYYLLRTSDKYVNSEVVIADTSTHSMKLASGIDVEGNLERGHRKSIRQCPLNYIEKNNNRFQTVILNNYNNIEKGARTAIKWFKGYSTPEKLVLYDEKNIYMYLLEIAYELLVGSSTNRKDYLLSPIENEMIGLWREYPKIKEKLREYLLSDTEIDYMKVRDIFVNCKKVDSNTGVDTTEVMKYLTTCILPKYYPLDKYGHGVKHIIKVYTEAIELNKYFKINEAVLAVAVFMHDLGCLQEREHHEIRSAELVDKDIFITLNFSKEQIEEIKLGIIEHRSSRSNPATSTLGKILAEADRDLSIETLIERYLLGSRAKFMDRGCTASEVTDHIYYDLYYKYMGDKVVCLPIGSKRNKDDLRKLKEILASKDILKELVESTLNRLRRDKQ